MKNRIINYFIGCFLFSIGAKFFINSNLGVDPLDSMLIGLANKFHCKIGTASAIIAILFLCVWSLWNKRKPVLTPFITMTLVGYLLDFWNYLLPRAEIITFPYSYELLIAGLLICSYASSLIIMSGIGIRTMDLVAITIVNKLKLPFVLSKGSIETSFIIAGYLLGGPLGVGTIAFLFLVGPLIQPFIMLNEKLLKITDFGLSNENSII